MGDEKVIGELAAVSIVGLTIGWAREISNAAGPLRKLHGVQESVGMQEMKELSNALVTALQAITLGRTRQLVEVLAPFSAGLDDLSAQVTAANCQCPKHQAQRETAARVQEGMDGRG